MDYLVVGGAGFVIGVTVGAIWIIREIVHDPENWQSGARMRSKKQSKKRAVEYGSVVEGR
jgi:hypothetical protein